MNKLILTQLTQTLLEVYAKKHLGRELTTDEKKRLIMYHGNKITYTRNKYYRELNKVIEDAVKQIGGTK